MLNGIAGYSQKGPRPESASGYYSVPQLRVTGSVLRGGQREDVTGEAWLDHEWSSAYLDERAAGWDWIGLNLDDGGALMAFRIRDRDGRTHWAGGTLRRPDGTQHPITEPLIPLLDTTLLTNAPGEPGLLNQLDAEIEAGAWMVFECLDDDLFSCVPEQLWRTVVRRQGGRMAWIAEAPDDLSAN
jgi:hypothetical protein